MTVEHTILKSSLCLPVKISPTTETIGFSISEKHHINPEMVLGYFSTYFPIAVQGWEFQLSPLNYFYPLKVNPREAKGTG